MRRLRHILLLATLAMTARGGEVLEILKTRDGREYHQVEVLEKDDVGLKIRHEGGAGRIAHDNLPADLQAKYKFDFRKAAAQKEKEKQALLDHERRQQPVVPEGKKAAAVKREAKSVAKRDANSKAFAPPADDLAADKLDAYISGMEVRVRDAQTDAARLRGLAEAERSRPPVARQTGDYYGRTRMVPDKSGYAKAKNYDEEAMALEQQAAKAKILIELARAKRISLSE